MDQAAFDAMVARLEAESAREPRRYLVKVALLSLLGFAILAFIVGFAGLGLVVIAGFAIAVAFMGTAAIVALLKFGKLLLLLAIPLWFLVKSSIASLFVRIPPPAGEEIGRDDAPKLFEALDRIRKAMRGPGFHHVLLVDDLTAGMTQRPLFGLFGFPRNYLVLGLPLLESLSPREAMAVVAHEYGHLAGSHARFGAFVYRLRRTWVNLQQVIDTWHGWASRPVQKLVGWYAPYFNAYTFVLARANEYEADRASARLVGADVAISALKRTNVVTAQYDSFLERTFDGIRDHAAPPADLALRWAAHATTALPKPLALEWLGKALTREPESHDTHPGLQQRLRALGQADEATAETPRAFAGPSAADAWLGAGAADFRERFQSRWRERVGEAWRERHEAVQASRRRLAELRAAAGTSSPDDRFELLRLRTELEPGTVSLDEWASFNAEHVDRAPALFQEGALRLDRDDEAGLALLDRAIALDPDAIKPATERAFAWLAPRKDPRADRYAERWRERDAWEALRAAQFAVLDPAHELRPADDASVIARADLERVHEIVWEERRGIARAWFARRVLPADPTVATFVLAIRPSWWTGALGREQKLVDRLAAREWPVPVHICTLSGRFGKLRKVLKKMPDARVDLR